MYRFIFGKNELFLVSSQRLLFFFVFFFVVVYFSPPPWPSCGYFEFTSWLEAFKGCLWVLVTF